MFTKREIELAPQVNEALTKLKWNGWEIQEGEWCLYKKKGYLIVNPASRNADDIWLNDFNRSTVFLAKVKKCIPILHWEDIERILQQNYIIGIRAIYNTRENREYKCVIAKRDSSGLGKKAEANGETRQESVMKAVVRLGENK